jgi:hypothetical protein
MLYGAKHHCLVLVHARGPHLEQVHAGLALLQRRGAIALQYRFSPPPDGPANPPMLSGHRSQLRVVLDRSIVIHYDLDDSAAISADAISGADVYFKRSVTREQLRRAKVFALGLNVPVRHSPSGVACLERAAVNARLRWQSGRRSHLLANRADWQYVPSLRELERRPSRASRVMFLTRVWSPEDGKDADQAAHRHAMNETRAQLVRLLRENLGPDFVGGFEPDEYALDAYPDCVVSAVTFTDKRRYLASLADCAIGIASEGLHSSVGWKMAEYVAASRAVVSERIEAVIPGGFRKSLNYLEFSSPKECLDNVLQLQADINAQSRMMQANHDYWRMSLRPDVLVGRTLKLALAQCGAVCGPNLAAVSVTDESSW